MFDDRYDWYSFPRESFSIELEFDQIEYYNAMENTQVHSHMLMKNAHPDWQVVLNLESHGNHFSIAINHPSFEQRFHSNLDHQLISQ